jgi:hypothetical protein
MPEFISEDDLKTFEGWLRYQGVDATTTPPEELERWRYYFDEARKRCAATAKVGLMKFQSVPGEYRYAVAIREGSDLWLTLWVRRSRRGEFFVMVPRADRDWDFHTSYHLDGALLMRSHGGTVLAPEKRQPLTGAFHGTESLGTFAGYGPKSVGAICDPTDFSGIVEVAPGVLGPCDGVIVVDLVEPGCEPTDFPLVQVKREIFRDIVPWVMITIWSAR